ncbi:hypothetical protein [Ideonella sp.]|uniref:hypothetical protein n=1 Tax=Ideonella sp. TaxID=1929293 RepID=UPI0035B3D9E7
MLELHGAPAYLLCAALLLMVAQLRLALLGYPHRAGGEGLVALSKYLRYAALLLFLLAVASP